MSFIFQFYVGGGTVIKRSDLELCADPFTMRGRVAELCNVFWGEECPLYAPSGRREKYGHLIDVKQVPEVHVKAMRSKQHASNFPATLPFVKSS